MLRKISGIPHKIRQAAVDFMLDFKKDERGLSGVVVAILLILIAVLAIVLIWGFLDGWLREVWDQITGAAGDIK